MKNVHHAKAMAVHVAKVAVHATKVVHAAMVRGHVTKAKVHAMRKVLVAKTAVMTTTPAANK